MQLEERTCAGGCGRKWRCLPSSPGRYASGRCAQFCKVGGKFSGTSWRENTPFGGTEVGISADAIFFKPLQLRPPAVVSKGKKAPQRPWLDKKPAEHFRGFKAPARLRLDKQINPCNISTDGEKLSAEI